MILPDGFRNCQSPNRGPKRRQSTLADKSRSPVADVIGWPAAFNKISRNWSPRRALQHDDEEDSMDVYERADYWRAIDPDPDFCRRAELDMLKLSCSDRHWLDARMAEFEEALLLPKLDVMERQAAE